MSPCPTIALIAPVPPFRGGIARHSHALAQAIARNQPGRIKVISFARLYPRLLYPGTSDRDPDSGPDKTIDVEYTIDTLNPLSWHRAAAAVIRSQTRVVVIPAWTFFVAPALGWIARRLQKAGIRVVMIVHNAADHDGGKWKARLLDWQIAGADAILTHSDDLEDQLRYNRHVQPTAICPHPTYSDYPPAKQALPRERKLELLCFGLVRPYKGVDIALQALAASGLPDVRLTIAGEIWDNGSQIAKLIQKLGLQDKVEVLDRYVSDDEAAELFARCDAVLAPYRTVTGSGVAALARHYHRPVIASDLSGFRNSIVESQTGWFFPVADTTALATLLQTRVSRASAAAMEGHLQAAASNDGWQDYVQVIQELALAPSTRPADGLGSPGSAKV
jgi:glycosyltransferase involved in cell wall biosynthesis